MKIVVTLNLFLIGSGLVTCIWSPLPSPAEITMERSEALLSFLLVSSMLASPTCKGNSKGSRSLESPWSEVTWGRMCTKGPELGTAGFGGSMFQQWNKVGNLYEGSIAKFSPALVSSHWDFTMQGCDLPHVY
ncbi:unnamed protein product [Eretmochelys imbricata]